MSDDTPRSGMNIDAALVRELAELLGETGLTEIEVEDGPRKIRVARQIQAAPVMASAAPAIAAPASAAAAPAPVAAPPAATPVPAANPASDPSAVKSPMVGTVYLAADPTAPVFAAVGSTVAEGDTIVIIEAMKVMNPITAPRGGTLTALHVDNGQPVEFDQPLFSIA